MVRDECSTCSISEKVIALLLALESPFLILDPAGQRDE
jgi:hypothetical protein